MKKVAKTKLRCQKHSRVLSGTSNATWRWYCPVDTSLQLGCLNEATQQAWLSSLRLFLLDSWVLPSKVLRLKQRPKTKSYQQDFQSVTSRKKFLRAKMLASKKQHLTFHLKTLAFVPTKRASKNVFFFLTDRRETKPKMKMNARDRFCFFGCWQQWERHDKSH